MKAGYGLGYFRTPDEVRNLVVHILGRYLGGYRGIKVLDAGCGRGEFLKALYMKGYWNVTGIEIWKNFVKTCRRFPNYRIIHSDFLSHKENYDVIISNPPYKKCSDIRDERLKENVLRFVGREQGNLYHAFMYKAVQLLNPNGIMVFIVPKSFLYNTYAEDLRRYLKKTGSIELLIDLNYEWVFRDSHQHAVIIVFRKGVYGKPLKYIQVNDKCQLSQVPRILERDSMTPPKNSKIVVRMYPQNRILLTEDEELEGVRIGDLIEDPFVGMVTGCDECFRLEPWEITSLTPRERLYVEDFVTSFDCKSYRIKSSSKYIFLEDISERELRNLPTIYGKLNRYKDRLESRYLPKSRKWYQFQDARNLNKFIWYAERHKIFVPMLTRNIMFSMSKEPLYALQSILVIVPKKEWKFFLLAYLNSQYFIEDYLKPLMMHGGRYVLRKSLLLRLPIPSLSRKAVDRLKILGRQLYMKDNAKIMNIISWKHRNTLYII